MRKSSASSLKLDQEIRECRLAYLSVLSSTTEDMTSSKELTLGELRESMIGLLKFVYLSV